MSKLSSQQKDSGYCNAVIAAAVVVVCVDGGNLLHYMLQSMDQRVITSYTADVCYVCVCGFHEWLAWLVVILFISNDKRLDYRCLCALDSSLPLFAHHSKKL